MNTVHGGDVTGYEMQYGRPPLDFSASLNPLGMPPAVQRAAIAAVEDSYAYPDPFARELQSALAEKLVVRQEHLLLGNGSADLIYRVVQAVRPGRAVLPVPSFAEYERALRAADCDIQYHTLKPEESFGLGEGILGEVTPDMDMLFLCQPGNPTGRLTDPCLLDKILERCEETGTLFFLDECFLTLVSGEGVPSMEGRVAAHPNLFILGSFTKLYGVAGIRLGYGLCGNTALLEKMAAASQPWVVSTVAQAAGLAALGQDAFVRESLRLIGEEKAWLAAALQALGIHVYGGAANYLFFSAQDVALKEKMAQRGILIRDCSNFRGLCPGYYRVAVRKRAENEQLVAALQAVLPRAASGA